MGDANAEPYFSNTPKVFNMALIWGCRPGVGIAFESKMALDIQKAFLRDIKSSMTCTFPQLMKPISASDCTFEIASSATLQDLILTYAVEEK